MKKVKSDRLVEGLIVIGISAVLLLILCGAFNPSGKVVADFFIGVFGYASFGYAVAGLIVGILLICGFKIKTTKAKFIGLMLMLITFIMIAHIASSEIYMGKYGEYLHHCYKSPSYKASGGTAGGVLAGVFMYPLMAINYYFAIVLAILLFIGSVFLAFYEDIMKKSVNISFKRKNKVRSDERTGGLIDLSEKGGMSDVPVSTDLYTTTIDGAKPIGAFGRSKEEFEYVPLSEIELRGAKSDEFVAPTAEAEQEPLSEMEQALNILYRDTARSFNEPEEKAEEKKDAFASAYDVLYAKHNEPSIAYGEPKKEEEPKEERKPALDGDYSSYSTNARMQTIMRNIEQYKSKDKEEEKTEAAGSGDNTYIPPAEEPKREETYSCIVEEPKMPVFMREKKETEQAREEINTAEIEREEAQDVKPQPFTREEKAVDLSATNRGPLESFEDKIKRMNERKELAEKEAREKELFGDRYQSAAEKLRKERSDKGGTHISPVKKAGGVIPSAGTGVAQDKSQAKEEVKTEIKPPIRRKPYVAPPISLLKEYVSAPPENEDFREKIDILENTLSSFNINAKVVNVVTGPAFTRLELQMPVGVSVNKINPYINDIAMCLEAKSVRCEIPIPGKNLFGVEIPNKSRGTVGLKSVFNSPEFNNTKQALSFAVGQDCDGANYVVDLTKMPHLLIAGATGAGKSVGINTLICSLLYKYSPEDVRMLLVDPKQVELSMFNGLPHMLIPESVSETDKVMNMLDWAVEEMENRYNLLCSRRVKNITEYNAKIDKEKEEKMPYIVIIVDEVGDIVVKCKKEFEERVVRIAQKARASGIILVLATQRPSVDVITGTIKANLPSRIAFAVTSFADSKTILDAGGAEKLLRNGDMLFQESTAPEPVRIQGAFISGEEVDAVCEYIRQHNESYFDSSIEQAINRTKSSGNGNTAVKAEAGEETDITFIRALQLFIATGEVSISKLQRRFSLGFPRAARLVDQMEEMGYISAQKDNKTRDVLITMDEFLALYGDVEIG